MPTVLRSRKLRVVIYRNDHRPSHVHVMGSGEEAVFNLNCTSGPIILRENFGFSRSRIRSIKRLRQENMAEYAKFGRECMEHFDEFQAANGRAKRLRANVPRATGAYYDRRSGRIVVNLSSSIAIMFAPKDAEGLEKATPAQLQRIEITPSGYGLHFPKIDADLYLPAVLEGFLGSKRWMASVLGRIGGKATTVAKKSASRQNGRLGGRPRKKSVSR